MLLMVCNAAECRCRVCESIGVDIKEVKERRSAFGRRVGRVSVPYSLGRISDTLRLKSRRKCGAQ